jgi:hypothetical protein
MENFIIIPFQSVNKKFNKDLKGLEIKNANGETVGTVISSVNNCGIAMVDKTVLEGSNKFNIDGFNTIIYDPLSLYESIRDLMNKNKSE